MKKSDVVKAILGERLHAAPANSTAEAFAPTNIALCKYWGKRDQELNLPVTPSLSISLGNKGAQIELKTNTLAHDTIILNGQTVDLFSVFGKRLIEFLNLFRKQGQPHFDMVIQSNIPIAAGLASSACGFASVVMALDKLYGWQLSPRELSIFARLGSGSACRSIWQGFVEWHAGTQSDGMDSHGVPLEAVWPELCIGLLIVSDKAKGISSREAMKRTVLTSSLFSAWPAKVDHDLAALKQAIQSKHFSSLGETAESNAMTMHATMLSAWPPVTYFTADTLTSMQKVWQLRLDGLPLYFTQDAGPNLKLLFLEKDLKSVQSYFPKLEVLKPF